MNSPHVYSTTEKVRGDLAFYVWTGVILYSLHTILNVIDFYQRRGWDLAGYAGFLVYFGLHLFILFKVKSLKNWARHIFIFKFILYAAVFYPQAFMLRVGSWMFSVHLPHGIFQKMTVYGSFVYEIFFVLFLIRRSVRLAFIRAHS